MAISLYSPEIEQHVLGLILRNPALFADISFIADKDFGTVRQRIYSVIRQQLEQVPPASVAPIILTEKLKSYGITAIEGVDMFTYLDGLSDRGRMLDKDQLVPLTKELKKMTIKRELLEKCDEAKQKVMKADTVEGMVGAVDSTLTSISTDYYRNTDAEEMFCTLIDRVEERGNDPIDPSTMGYGGVMPSIERALGPLIGKAHFVNVAARQSSGKSSFAFFYAVMTAEKHNLPILWVDAGEMTLEQLQMRAVCCLSKGRVPLWAVRSGKWRQNIEWEKIVRHEVWPRVRKLKLYYRSVSGMSPKEKVAYMRRFYFNKIGRGNFLIIVDDYLKGMEHLTKDSTEWQGMGYYVADVKSLVTDEIDASFWTSTQANKLGIVKGKKMADIVDNDSVVSLSDRINHNATHSLLLRQKVAEELAMEKNSYGNMVAKVLKIRDGLGIDFERFLQPVKLGASYADNYFNLESHGFHYLDKGWYSDMLAGLGHTAIDLGKHRKADELP